MESRLQAPSGVYIWLLRKLGFEVDDQGFFLCANGHEGKQFDHKLSFAISLLPYAGNTNWIEPTLRKIKTCLMEDALPLAPVDCEFCDYVKRPRRWRHKGGERRRQRYSNWYSGQVLGRGSADRYSLIKHRGPPSQTWRTFLRNHADAIAAIDLCLVPTLTFECLFAFLVVNHGRRQLLWFAVTKHPTAEWLAQQIVEAFPWDTAPRYLIRDNDAAYGQAFTNRVRRMGIRDRPIAPRSPWQNPYVERLIGTLRRECLDHVLILGERHLRRVLTLYALYYNETRTHLGLAKDAPRRRAVQRCGRILATPILSGLHHHYARI